MSFVAVLENRVIKSTAGSYELVFCRHSFGLGALTGGVTGIMIAAFLAISGLLGWWREALAVVTIGPVFGLAFGGWAVLAFTKNIPATLVYIFGSTVAIICPALIAEVAFSPIGQDFGKGVRLALIFLVIFVILIPTAVKLFYVLWLIKDENKINALNWIVGFQLGLALGGPLTFIAFIL